MTSAQQTISGDIGAITQAFERIKNARDQRDRAYKNRDMWAVGLAESFVAAEPAEPINAAAQRYTNARREVEAAHDELRAAHEALRRASYAFSDAALSMLREAHVQEATCSSIAACITNLIAEGAEQEVVARQVAEHSAAQAAHAAALKAFQETAHNPQKAASDE